MKMKEASLFLLISIALSLFITSNGLAYDKILFKSPQPLMSSSEHKPFEHFNHRNHKTSFESEFTLDPTITRYPVVLIPGDGGNQLYAKLNKTSAPHYFCQLKTSDFFELWLNLQEITPYVIDCFIDNIRLVYDSTSKKSYNSPGVEMSVKGFGDTWTVEYLDTSKYSVTAYFAQIVDAFVTKLKYVKGVNIRGAPYDWRKAPDELNDFYRNFTKLVEDTYSMNNNTKVMLIAHSMGNPVTLYWLNNYVNQTWKDTYIRMFVSLSGVWGGAAKTLRLMASGDNIDIVVVKPIRVRPYQR
jgi:lysophospholipase III